MSNRCPTVRPDDSDLGDFPVRRGKGRCYDKRTGAVGVLGRRPVEAPVVRAMCARAFGSDVEVRSVVELGYGTYNSTYRIDIGAEAPVVLRVAPEPALQFRCERELMRNEYVSLPYLAPIGSLLPRTLAIDFTHDLIGRDYLFQSMLPGLPAPDGLARYPRSEWTEFFEQLGTIARQVHGVRGERFGRVGGPTYDTWSAALLGCFDDIAADLDAIGLDASDVRQVARFALQRRDVLDEITEPRLLHGDLWTVNVMVETDAPVPTICGVLDGDRTLWGDPLADWTLWMAGLRQGTERDAFWDTYGRLPSTPEANLRMLFYRARHVGGIRVERYRLGKHDELDDTYDQLRALLDQLGGVDHEEDR